jgi:uncharacterized protein
MSARRLLPLLESAIEFSLYLWLLLLAASFFAGLVDAVAGGGGLIQVPALFAAYPEAQPATLLGTGKVSAIGGTINAARKYLRYVRLPWALIVPVIIAGFVGSLLGAECGQCFSCGAAAQGPPFLIVFSIDLYVFSTIAWPRSSAEGA